MTATDNNTKHLNDKTTNKSEVRATQLVLHNPTPVHPKANQIISFPTTMATVTIHYLQDQNTNDLITNNNKDNNNYNKICMV